MGKTNRVVERVNIMVTEWENENKRMEKRLRRRLKGVKARVGLRLIVKG